MKFITPWPSELIALSMDKDADVVSKRIEEAQDRQDNLYDARYKIPLEDLKQWIAEYWFVTLSISLMIALEHVMVGNDLRSFLPDYMKRVQKAAKAILKEG